MLAVDLQLEEERVKYSLCSSSSSFSTYISSFKVEVRAVIKEQR